MIGDLPERLLRCCGRKRWSGLIRSLPWRWSGPSGVAVRSGPKCAAIGFAHDEHGGVKTGAPSGRVQRIDLSAARVFAADLRRWTRPPQGGVFQGVLDTGHVRVRRYWITLSR